MSARATLVTSLVMFLIFGILNMAITGRLHINQSWMFIENLAAGLLAYWWYQQDRKQLNYKNSYLLGIGIFLYSLLMLPIYLFISRGKKRGAIAFLKYVLLLFAIVFTFAIGGLIGKSTIPLTHHTSGGLTALLN